MHPLAVWSIALQRQQAFRDEAESDRVAHLAHAADRSAGQLPGPARLVARASGRVLGVAGRAALDASGRLDAIGRVQFHCPDQGGRATG